MAAQLYTTKNRELTSADAKLLLSEYAKLQGEAVAFLNKASQKYNNCSTPADLAAATGEVDAQYRKLSAAMHMFNFAVRFVDMKQVATAELGMCGKDGERHVSALIDGRPQDYTMPIHPTYAGSEAIANQIVANR